MYKMVANKCYAYTNSLKQKQNLKSRQFKYIPKLMIIPRYLSPKLTLKMEMQTNLKRQYKVRIKCHRVKTENFEICKPFNSNDIKAIVASQRSNGALYYKIKWLNGTA